MSSAAAVRFHIEAALAARIPGALTPKPRIVRDVAVTGVTELDTLLEGGLPVGAITELVGTHSSGRTTLALATLAEMTQAGKTVAWVDASDTLDPESAAAAGVNLDNQLWVRCGRKTSLPDVRSAKADNGTQSPGAAFVVAGSRTPAPSGGCGSPHPRAEVRGLSKAVDAFLHPDVFARPAPPRDPAVPRRNRMIGTPGAPNRKILDRTPQDARPLPRRARDREEQIPTDRQPSRRQSLEAQRHSAAESGSLASAQIANTASAAQARQKGGTWTDNQKNAAGRSFATPPNAIAAGLPRFREMEARAKDQGRGTLHTSEPWKPMWQGTLPSHESARGQLPGHSGEVPQTAPIRLPTDQHGKTLNNTLAREGVTPDRNRPGTGRKIQSSLAGDPPGGPGHKTSPVWRALDQALRATDLLLAAGGFSAIVLDLGNILPEFAWRIPLATWFRFRAAADRARTVLVLLTQHPCARSSAELVLRLHPAKAQSAKTVLTGAQFHISVDRRRFERLPSPATLPQMNPGEPGRLHLVPKKQPQAERAVTWSRNSAWTGTHRAKTQESFA